MEALGQAGLQLSSCPPSVLQFFVEYESLVDFAMYSTGVYLFTEAYFFVLSPTLLCYGTWLLWPSFGDSAG